MSLSTQPVEPITHKEENKLWTDYEHDWPTTSVPRNPTFYQPAPASNDMMKPHFLRKAGELPDERRGEIIKNCIENGSLYPAEEDNRYRFLWVDEVSGELYSLIVNLRAVAFAKEAEKHYAVTVYRVE